jgi:hypothetical protein
VSAPLGWIRQAGEHCDEPAEDLRPAGVNPADVYSWFHDGPGLGEYQHAREILDELVAGFAEYVELARNTTLLAAAEALLRHATIASDTLAGQLITFNDAKIRVRPARLPSVAEFTRPFASDEHSADAVVAGYRHVARENQNAYAEYQAHTAAQGKALPR